MCGLEETLATSYFSLYPKILLEVLFKRALSSFILSLLGVTLNAKLIREGKLLS